MNPALLKIASNLKQRYNSVSPENKKRTIYIIVFVVFVLLFRKRISNFFQSLMHNDVNKLEVNNSNLTFDKSEYFSICSSLEAAMAGTGTQEETIIEVLMRLRTQDDWNYLQKSFGNRKKDGGTFFADITGDLKAWLTDELDTSDLAEIRKNFAVNNINY
jgi:hypothetical protein